MNTTDEKQEWVVYILKCTDDTFHAGCSGNFINRLAQHNQGLVYYTSTRLPVEVVWRATFKYKYLAYKFEKYLKSGSGIAFRNKRLI